MHLHAVYSLLLLVVLLPSFATGLSQPQALDEIKTVGSGTATSCTEEALDDALAGGGTLHFLCGGAHTITVTSPKVIKADTALEGRTLITLSGGDTTGIFIVEPGVALTLDSMILSRGRELRQGGAIDNFGHVVLRYSSVEHNTVTVADQDCDRVPYCGGAGIYNHDGAVLELDQSRVIGNTGGWYGGGIYSAGRLTVVDSEFRENRSQGSGGAITSDGATEIRDSTFSDNVAVEAFGGAIAVFSGTLTLATSVVKGNRAMRHGGGLMLSGFAALPDEPSATRVAIHDTVIRDNTAGTATNDHGGGIYATGGLLLELTRATVTGNRVSGSGGGLFSWLSDTGVHVSESTFSGNQAFNGGGAIENHGRMLVATTEVLSNTVTGDDSAPCLEPINDTCGGGGLNNISGTLELRDSTVAENRSRTFGGGIASHFGRLSVVTSLVHNNSTDYSGGGLYLRGKTTVEDSVVTGNRATVAGGVIVVAGPVTIRRSTIENNSVSNGGGAGVLITYAVDAGPSVVDIFDSRVTGNDAIAPGARLARGGGIHNFGGTLTISRTTIAENQAEGGGGIYSELEQARLVLVESTVSGNVASGDENLGTGGENHGTGGGIMVQGGAADLVNTTLSGNRAARSGGGLEAGDGQTELAYVTLAANSAPEGASLDQNDGTIAMRTTILQNPVGSTNCRGSENLTSGGQNLADDDSCGLAGPGDRQNGDALLGPLTENGGPTLSHLPAATGPAIDVAVVACPLRDQRGYRRPAGAACDIGALEIDGEAPPSPDDPTPTATTPPQPTPTATIAPFDKPAPELEPADPPGAVRPTIALNPTRGYLDQELTVLGTVPAGYGRVRVSAVVDGQTIGNTLATVSGGTYSTVIRVDEQFPEGPIEICAAVTGEENAALECAPFVVDPAPLTTVQGTIPIVPGTPVNATMRLMNAAGATIYSAPIAANGSFRIENVEAGTYRYAVTGQLRQGIEAGVATIKRGFGVLDLRPAPLISCFIGVRNPPASASLEARPSRVAGDPVHLRGGTGWTTATQIRPFGVYVSGVSTPVTFTAFPLASGAVRQMRFALLDLRGFTIPGTERVINGPPFVTTYDVGALPPSIGTIHPEVMATPIVNGKDQCPSFFPIEMMVNPLSLALNDYLQPGSRLFWDAIGGVYRYDVILPYVEGLLPADYQVNAGLLGTLHNRLNAGIRVTGFFNLDTIGKVELMEAIAEAKLLDIQLFGPGAVYSFTPPNHELPFNNLRAIGIPYSKPDLFGPKRFGPPYIKIPVFSFAGLVTVKVVIGGGFELGVGLSGVVRPLLPAVEATLLGHGSAIFEFGIAVDIIFGFAEVGITIGVGIRVGLPLRTDIGPDGFDIGLRDPCLDLVGRLRVYAEALWGLFSTETTKVLFDTGNCRGALEAVGVDQDEEPLPAPRQIASPSIAIAPSGRGLSAYIENTAAADATPDFRVLARFQDPATGAWTTSQAISNPAVDVRNPVVAFAGPEAMPVVAWVQNTLTRAEAQALQEGDLQGAYRNQEIMVSTWNGTAWSEPIRLTDDTAADGLPAMAGSVGGAALAWTRDADGNPETRDDMRVAVSRLDPMTGQFGVPELLSMGDGMNGDVDVAYDNGGEQPVPYVVWVHDADADLATAGDRRIALASRPDTDWVLLNPQPLPPRVDSPTITVGPEGVRLAFLVRQPDPAGEPGEEPPLIGVNGALWTARESGGEWLTAAVEDEQGEPVLAERPVLESFGSEALLLVRRFDESTPNTSIGQLSLIRIVAADLPSPPLYITDQPRQNWGQDMAINPRTGRASIVKVTASFDGVGAGARSIGQALPTRALTALNEATDPVTMLSLPAVADPALDPLVVSPAAPAPGELVTVRATVRNVGRGLARDLRLRLFSGNPGSGTLLRTGAVPGTLDFNETRTVEMRVPGVAGESRLYVEVSGGDNATGANDGAVFTLGRLHAPAGGVAGPSSRYRDALELAWPLEGADYVTGYRLLRSTAPDGKYELVGETTLPSFVDSLVEREQQYCYRVQSYNRAGAFSPLSEPWCGTLQRAVADNRVSYLPLFQR